MSQCTTFIASCYGYSCESDMAYLPYMVLINNMAIHKLNPASKLRVHHPPKSFSATCTEHTRRLVFGDVHAMLIHMISILCIMDDP